MAAQRRKHFRVHGGRRQMKKIEGTVVELEPRTPVSTGRLLVRDSSSGELVELPAPMLLED